jgi:hypothetical protein
MRVYAEAAAALYELRAKLLVDSGRSVDGVVEGGWIRVGKRHHDTGMYEVGNSQGQAPHPGKIRKKVEARAEIVERASGTLFNYFDLFQEDGEVTGSHITSSQGGAGCDDDAKQ